MQQSTTRSRPNRRLQPGGRQINTSQSRKFLLPRAARFGLAVALVLPISLTAWLHEARAQSGQALAVTVTEDADYFTLSNGIVTARVRKTDGDLHSFVYNGTEMLTDQSGRPGGHWSHDPTGGADHLTRVTIDPASNGGERAEVSVTGISGGINMGHGPGAGPDGDFPADIDVRYTLDRGEAGLYTWSIFEHQPEYAAATMTEARYAIKLADFLDWLHADELRNKLYPEPVPTEDKYVYTAVQFDNRAFGFSSTTRDLGFFFVNPTVEFLSGGPTKPEFLVHHDTTEVAAPVVLNYWRSSHYGGANVTVAEGESWTKVIGPFLLYANEGSSPDAMWADARAKAAEEAAKWPYDWVDAPSYATSDERGSVSGQLVLNDAELDEFPGRILVGLAQPTHTVTMPGGREQTITWQTDAKHYQFWVESFDADGGFTIPKVSPGEYTLYALADGVLGEFTHDNVRVGEGESIELGELNWEPVRYGRQVWEIGVPNRTATEFNGAERFFEPDISLQYASLFPDDVTYTIGESRPSQDWFFAHVPHNTDPDAGVQPFRGVRGNGRATPYIIEFELDSAPAEQSPQATAILRFALSGTQTRSIDVGVNGEPAGNVQLGLGDGVISRHQIQGIWNEYRLEFDASLLQSGHNTLTLTVPAGNVTAGVIYDYLRLELNDSL